jgi:hypothetical protein
MELYAYGYYVSKHVDILIEYIDSENNSRDVLEVSGLYFLDAVLSAEHC